MNWFWILAAFIIAWVGGLLVAALCGASARGGDK